MAHPKVLYLTHRKKREGKIKRDVKRGIREANEQDPFEIFVTVMDIRFKYVSHPDLKEILFQRISDTIKNRTRFWEIPLGCVGCKSSKQLHRIC